MVYITRALSTVLLHSRETSRARQAEQDKQSKTDDTTEQLYGHSVCTSRELSLLYSNLNFGTIPCGNNFLYNASSITSLSTGLVKYIASNNVK